MKKILILSWLLFVITQLTFAVDDTLFVQTIEGKWMKVIFQKEYENVPTNFQSEDFWYIEKYGVIDKVVGEETESYVLDTKFPFLFSQKHRMVQQYRLTGNNFIETSGDTRKDISMTAHSKSPDYFLFVLCVVLFVSITLVSLFSFDIKKFFGYLAALIFCFLIGLFFQEKEILLAVLLSGLIGWFVSKIYEGFNHEGLLFVAVIISTCCVSVVSIVFTQDGFTSEMIFGLVVIGFALSILLLRAFFEYLIRWRLGFIKRKYKLKSSLCVAIFVLLTNRSINILYKLN